MESGSLWQGLTTAPTVEQGWTKEMMMNDLISRQAAIYAPEIFIKDCNPEHFVGHEKFIEYMDNVEIGSFGNWQFANGFNMGLTAAEVAIKKLPPVQSEIEDKILAIGYTGKEGRIYIGGRLFAVRELAQ